jgi:hypothetical protein
MPDYCNTGERATLYYQFPDSAMQKQVFEFPISVEIKNSAPQNYNPDGYKLTLKLYDPFSSSVGGYGMASFIVRGYSVGDNNPNYGQSVTIIDCSGASKGVGFIWPQDMGTIFIDSSVKCSSPSEDTTDTITVKPKGTNKILFTATGKHAVSYNVVCGDECPPGHIKCDCNEYPGFCCIPCSEIIGGIRSAISAIRGISNG